MSTASSPSDVQGRPLPANDQPVPLRRIYLMALVELVVGASLTAPLVISLSLKILALVPASRKETALSAVTAIGALVALIANPVFGYLSDHTRSRFGRRRPWMMGGALIGLIASVTMARASSLTVLIIGWSLTQAAYNAVLAALSALLAEQVPESQRSRASGIFGAFGFLGIVPAMVVAGLFATHLTVVIVVMPIIAVAVIALCCLKLPDAPSAHDVTTVGRKLGFGEFFFNPLRYRVFSMLWLQRFFMQFGYTVVATYGLYYLMLRLGMAATEGARLTSMATIIGAALNFLAAFGFGYLASKNGNYKPYLLLSTGLMALCLALKAFTGNLAIFWICTALAGFALGTYYAVDLALAMRALPTGSEGRFLGIFNIAKTLPQSIAPAVAPLAIAIGGPDPVAGGDKNYATLYLVGTAAVLASMLLVRGVRPILRRPPETPAPIRDSAGVTPAAQPEAVGER